MARSSTNIDSKGVTKDLNPFDATFTKNWEMAPPQIANPQPPYPPVPSDGPKIKVLFCLPLAPASLL